MVVVIVVGIVSAIIYGSATSINDRAVFTRAQLFSQKINNSLADSIAGEWTLYEGAGSSASDSSGNGNTGTITGATWETTKTNCVSDNCLNFSGSNQYVSKASPVNLPSGQSARTISVWVYPNNVNPGGSIVSLSNTAATSQSFILMINYIDPNTYLFTDAINGNNNITISGEEIPSAGKWSNMVFSFDGGSSWKYYLNGELKKQGTFGTQINTVENDISIGRRADGSSYSYWPGRIDEVVIFSSVLSAFQVEERYYSELNKFFIEGCLDGKEYQEILGRK